MVSATTRRAAKAPEIVEDQGHDGADSGSEPLRLDNNLAYRLSFVSFLVSKATLQIHGAEGISTNEWRVLSVLYSHEPMSAQAISQCVSLDKSAISRAVRALLKRGLVQRKLDIVDARTAEIKMSARGHRIYDAIARRTAALQHDLLADMTAAERGLLFDLLGRVQAKLRPAQEPKS